MTAIAVFAYGSLVDPHSAALTLGREVEPMPARLDGWRRRWSQARDNLSAEKTFAARPGGSLPPRILGLNIEPDPGAIPGPNGALIEVDEAELAALDLRELRYDRVKVTIPSHADHFMTIFSYTAKPENFAPRPPAGSVVVAAYAGTVERAFAALGPTELMTYLATTDPPPVDVIDAELVSGDEIPVGNPRQW